MKNDKLDILIKQADDNMPHWMFCRLFAMLQWNV